jgi:hypothetical protein
LGARGRRRCPGSRSSCGRRSGVPARRHDRGTRPHGGPSRSAGALGRDRRSRTTDGRPGHRRRRHRACARSHDQRLARGRNRDPRDRIHAADRCRRPGGRRRGNRCRNGAGHHTSVRSDGPRHGNHHRADRRRRTSGRSDGPRHGNRHQADWHRSRRTARSGGPRRGTRPRNGRSRRRTSAGRRRNRRHALDTRRRAVRPRGGHCCGTRRRAGHCRRRGATDDRRRSLPRGEGRRTRRPGHHSGGIQTRPGETPNRTSDSQSRRRGHGHFRSVALRRLSHRAGSRRTGGRTSRGCTRRDPPRRGCHRRGSNHRGRRHRGRSRRRSRGPRWGACRPRHGHATTRRCIRRRQNRRATRRSRLGRQPPHATRRRTRLDPNNRRSARRTGRSHPSRQSLLGVRNRQSHGPRHRWGDRAHHRRRRAPARCRLQPLKPPPERIISSAYPPQTPSPTRLRESLTSLAEAILSCCYPLIAIHRNCRERWCAKGAFRPTLAGPKAHLAYRARMERHNAKKPAPGGRLLWMICAAVSYSPARPPSQYHRR